MTSPADTRPGVSLSGGKAWEALSEDLTNLFTSTDRSVLDAYTTDPDHPPERILRIHDTRMLTATIKAARKEGVPLFATSSHPPRCRSLHGVGKGSWMLDFSGMREVLKINRRNRMIMFEAGVTFEQLAPQVRGEGLRMMMPLMPRRGKSVMASCLDREPTIYPRYQWDLSDPMLCLEVVFGTGDVFRTGAAAGPGSVEEQWAVGDYQKSPMGPGQNDWFRMIQGAQGTIGLVTWASAKCEVKPKMETLLVAGSEKPAALLEASYRMFYRKLTDIHFIMNRHALACLVAKTPEQYQAASRQISDWNLVCSVSGIHYFPEERMRYLLGETEKELKKQKVSAISAPLMSEEQLLKMLQMPNSLTTEEKNRLSAGFSPEKHWKDRLSGAHGEIYFQSTMDRAEALIGRLSQLANDAGIADNRKGVYIQPQLGGRCCHIEFILAADADDAAATARVHEFCNHAVVPMTDAGAFFSRPHGPWAESALTKTSSAIDVFCKIKQIFDPDGILAPGRLMTGDGHHAQNH